MFEDKNHLSNIIYYIHLNYSNLSYNSLTEKI